MSANNSGDALPQPSPGDPRPENFDSQSSHSTLTPTLRQAVPTDAAAIHALMRPFVAQRLLLDRTEGEIIELTRHGFVAVLESEGSVERCVGFSAIEIYSPKLAELQCLAVHPDYQRSGVGRNLVQMCIDRARGLGVMEVMAISSSGNFLENCGFDYALPDQKRALFMQLRPRHIEDDRPLPDHKS